VARHLFDIVKLPIALSRLKHALLIARAMQPGQFEAAKQQVGTLRRAVEAVLIAMIIDDIQALPSFAKKSVQLKAALQKASRRRKEKSNRQVSLNQQKSKKSYNDVEITPKRYSRK
jgi:hypothetical protein